MILSIVFKPSERSSGGFFVYDSTKVLLRVSGTVSTIEDVHALLYDAYVKLHNTGYRGLVHLQFYEYYSTGEDIHYFMRFKKRYPRHIEVLDL
jgi:hypothetical protein